MRALLAIGLWTALSVAAQAQTYSQTIQGSALAPYNSSAAPNGTALELWGNTAGSASLTITQGGTYTIAVTQQQKTGASGSAWTELRVDDQLVPYGTRWGNVITSTSPQTYNYGTYLRAGPHKFTVSLMNAGSGFSGSLLVNSLVVTSPGPTSPTAEPTGTRDPRLYPYSSWSIWNTAIGQGASWGANTDADVATLQGKLLTTPPAGSGLTPAYLSGALNAGQWSMPIYTPGVGDPLVTVTDTDPTYPLDPARFKIRLPATATAAAPSSGGDHHINAYSSDGRTLLHMFGCTQTAEGWICGQSQVDDVCGNGMGGYGWAAGVIRTQELLDGSIKHMLRYTLPLDATKPGHDAAGNASWLQGLAWPAQRSDYNAASYSGAILYGSTIGIPYNTDLSSLGLTAGGQVLATVLKTYGAMQRDTVGTSENVTLYAEAAAETAAPTQLQQMRTDWPKLVPYLSIMRNQTNTTVNGGGARLAGTLPGLSTSICP